MAKRTKNDDPGEGEPDQTAAGGGLERFEQDLAEVERIVRELEGGELTLAQSLEVYQRGVGKLKSCYESLASAQRQVEILTGVGDRGAPVTSPFEADQLSLEEKLAARGRRRGSAGEEETAEEKPAAPRGTRRPAPPRQADESHELF